MMTVEWKLPTPDDSSSHKGLILTAEAIAGQAWADRIDPRIERFVKEVTFGEPTPLGQVERLHARLVPWSPQPDADDYAIAMASACLAAGLEVCLILAHQRGLNAHACTIFVSVRVAFSLDADQDRAESWVVYGPEGRTEWPSPLIDSYAYVGVPGRQS